MPTKTFSLRQLDTAKSLTPEELEIINKNFWDIEQAIVSVGGTAPGSFVFAPVDTFLKFTSKGPSFAKVITSDVPLHDSSKHEDRIRTILLPVGAWGIDAIATIGVTGTDPDVVSHISMPNALDSYINYLFMVPNDFFSNPVFGVYALEPTADGNDFDLSLYTKNLPMSITDVTAAYDNQDDFQLTPNGANKIQLGETVITTSMLAGDVLRLTLKRSSTDPNATNMKFLGAFFEYIADM